MSFELATASATAVGIPGLYKDQNLFHTINRRRTNQPLEMLNFRRGVGDLVCLREVTGGSGGPYTPRSQSATDVCEQILRNDPNSLMGAYLDCVNNIMTEGINACGFSYKKWPQTNECDTRCQYITSDLVNDAVYRKDYHYPSAEALDASRSYWTQLGDEGCGCWD